MSVSFCLFGRLSLFEGKITLKSLEHKTQELLAYLLLYRDRPHAREMLASVLWGETSTAKSMKQLRQAIWQLKAVLEPLAPALLHVEEDWLLISSEALCLDVAQLEGAFTLSSRRAGSELDEGEAATLRQTVALYHSDLLLGWTQDWCLFERERLQNYYLIMLDKLMDYSTLHHDYEAGLVYGTRSLAHDWARECTHQRLMRLYCLMGNRTAALRQYHRCVSALRAELDVVPSRATQRLYDAIEQDRWPELDRGEEVLALSLHDLLVQVQTTLNRIQQALGTEQAAPEAIKDLLKRS